MLSNLRLVLHQNKKFLATFFLVVFLPSLILAYFGIRAIRNERYKLQQLNLEQHRECVRTLEAAVASLLERETAGLREFSTSRAMVDRDYRSFYELVASRIQDKSVLGQVVLFYGDGLLWFPGLAAQPPPTPAPDAPAEWKRMQQDLARAERSEFQLRNYPEAISLYGQVLQRSKDNTVKAWIKSRIARCQVKQKDFKQAAATYRSIIEEFPGLLTESGRSLEIASRTEVLDALRADGNLPDFFPEALQTLRHLETDYWSISGDHAELYESLVSQTITETLRQSPPGHVPEKFEAEIKEIRDSLHEKRSVRRLAEAVEKDILPGIRNKAEGSASARQAIYRDAVEFEGNDVLVLLAPLDKQKTGGAGEFLGSLLQVGDLKESLDARLKENSPPGLSILLRSTSSEKTLYGAEKPPGWTPASTGFFPENFPPWRIEVFQDEGVGSGTPLYGNVFFWIILALLVIVFFGSGLIIRTIIQEVDLLNLKSEFIASVSHEFKTPLTAMGAILERLLSNEVQDPKKVQEYYRTLNHDSERLKRLVKNVLDFTKIEDGKKEYRLEAIDLGQLVRLEVEIFQEENELAGFRVETRIDENLPPVPADEEALRQALHNILDNAAKFSRREKTIEVAVSIRPDSVEIAVEDNGIGIPENEQKKVFEKFYRGKQASSVSPTGTGLGLTLVKHIMDAHGGEVVIRSQPGKGTLVSLILPLEKGR
jgi:signal transduction histidine kinase/tetratricopeptide (TPR) repeat protein